MTDEQELIRKAQAGDTDAFRALVDSSKLLVFRLAQDLTGNRHDAEDLSQEVFVKAFRSLHTFRRESKWNTWIYRITMNACLDHREAASRHAMISDQELSDPSLLSDERSGTPAPDRVADSRLMAQHIEKALSTLSTRERAVFTLRHYHDLPLKEIAAALEITEGSVKSYLFRALQRLQQQLSVYRTDAGMELPS